MPHFYELFARCQIDLYTGNGVAAWRRLEASWRPLARSMLARRSESIRISAEFLRARCALAAAVADPATRAHHLAEASAAARRLEREQNGWNRAKAAVVRACVDDITGVTDAAVDGYTTAITRFEACGMALHAASARLRRGALVQGAAGAAEVDAARAWMAGEGIVQPNRMAALLVPGPRS
jgi:hypothetical protein